MTLEKTNNFIVGLKMDTVLVVQFEIGSLEVELHSGYMAHHYGGLGK